MRPLIVLLVVLATASTPALAGDTQYQNIDPKIKEWFNGLRNGTNHPCCDEADGKILEQDEVEYDSQGTQYRVKIKGKWYVIDDLHLLKGPNLIGRAVVWYVMSGDHAYIFCFIPGAQS